MGRFVSPNNIDLTSDAFAMLPADDSYIPSLDSQINGENYFDPTTGMLYLLLTGEEPVDYKIQPSVVTKIGATIDMDNFFEGDVAGNIAALLGIDPANIRVTNIGGGAAMEIGDLKTAMADLSNGFQNGSIGGALGMNVTTMAMQEPIYVPTPEDLPPQCLWQDEDPLADCYLDPSQNGQDGIPWSEASIANATAKLEESLAVKELKVPKKLMVMEEPGNAFEMLPFGVQPVIYAVDQDGKYVNEVGGEADPWLVTASVSNGTGLLINNITCSFKAGLDVAPLTATCTISLSPDAVAAGAALSGVTEVAVLDGEANFAELEVTGEVTGSQLMVSCSDADDFNHVGASGDFNVHRYPRTGNLKETSQKFSFKGDGQKLKNVMAAMGDFLQSSMAGVRK